MKAGKTVYRSVDEYLAAQPASRRKLLEKLRQTIKKAAPHAIELISYNIPAYKQEGMLVYFASFTHHIGFYPTSSGITNFKAALAAYKTSRGAVQFPGEGPLPLDLVSRIVKARVQENIERARVNKLAKKGLATPGERQSRKKV